MGATAWCISAENKKEKGTLGNNGLSGWNRVGGAGGGGKSKRLLGLCEHH